MLNIKKIICYLFNLQYTSGQLKLKRNILIIWTFRNWNLATKSIRKLPIFMGKDADERRLSFFKHVYWTLWCSCGLYVTFSHPSLQEHAQNMSIQLIHRMKKKKNISGCENVEFKDIVHPEVLHCHLKKITKGAILGKEKQPSEYGFTLR